MPLPTEEELGQKKQLDLTQGFALDHQPDDAAESLKFSRDQGVSFGEAEKMRPKLVGKGTHGITPPKSNWAQRLDTPPYVGFGVTCGITFTFGGLRVDLRAQVQDIEDQPIRGLYAAGELVGGLFYHNYPGGAGLTAGSVFGKAAGDSAAADLGFKAR